jgi:hypothetical protein
VQTAIEAAPHPDAGVGMFAFEALLAAFPLATLTDAAVEHLYFTACNLANPTVLQLLLDHNIACRLHDTDVYRALHLINGNERDVSRHGCPSRRAQSLSRNVARQVCRHVLATSDSLPRIVTKDVDVGELP